MVISGNLGVGTTATNGIYVAVDKYVIIEGSSTGKALSIGGFGLIEVDGPGVVGGRFKIDKSGNITNSGTSTIGGRTYCNGGLTVASNNWVYDAMVDKDFILDIMDFILGIMEQHITMVIMLREHIITNLEF